MIDPDLHYEMTVEQDYIEGLYNDQFAEKELEEEYAYERTA